MRTPSALGRATVTLVLIASSACVVHVPERPPPPGSAQPPPSQLPMGGIATGAVLSRPVDRDLALIASIVPGGFVRSDYSWAAVQPHPDRWSWAEYDARIDAVHGAGLEVLAMIGYSPAWANGGSGDDKRPPAPAFVPHWRQFCRQFARRYVPRGVTVFEVWNEPNIARFWTPGPNVAHYVRDVLAPCSTGLREAARGLGVDITVLTAGTAPAVNGTNIDPRTWVAGLYANGAQDHFDAIAHHPYTWPYPPGENAAMDASSFAPNQWNAMVQTLDIRSTMRRHGDGAKRIWATEVGLPSRAGAATYPAPGHQGFVSPDVMVGRIGEIFDAWFDLPSAADPGWAGPLIWYQHRDQAPVGPGTGAEGGFGVVDHAGADKPARTTPRDALTAAFAAHG